MGQRPFNSAWNGDSNNIQKFCKNVEAKYGNLKPLNKCCFRPLVADEYIRIQERLKTFLYFSHNKHDDAKLL